MKNVELYAFCMEQNTLRVCSSKMKYLNHDGIPMLGTSKHQQTTARLIGNVHAMWNVKEHCCNFSYNSVQKVSQETSKRWFLKNKKARHFKDTAWFLRHTLHSTSRIYCLQNIASFPVLNGKKICGAVCVTPHRPITQFPFSEKEQTRA